MLPLVVIRPILLPPTSVNHRAPSGPEAISCGTLLAVGIANAVMAPDVVMLAILLPPISVNHRLPSGPAMMPPGFPDALNSVMTPAVVISPILFPLTSVNQSVRLARISHAV
jgi:hypothetical protein